MNILLAKFSKGEKVGKTRCFHTLNKSLSSAFTNFFSLWYKKLGCASVKKRIKSFVLLSAFTNFFSLCDKKLGCASVKKRIKSFVLLSAFTNFAV